MKQSSKLKDLIAMLAFAMLLIIACWTFLYSWQDQSAELASDKHLIVLSSFHGYLPGAIVGLVFMLGYATNSFWLALQNQQSAANKGKITAIGVLAGLLLIVIGNFAINKYWHSSAEYLGYQPCPALALLTNRVTIEAWSKNEALCYDSEVHRIVSRGTTDETTQLERLLAARQKQQQARQRFLQQEAELKQRRASSGGD